MMETRPKIFTVNEVTELTKLLNKFDDNPNNRMDYDNINTAFTLIKTGMNVNTRNQNGETLLMLITKSGYLYDARYYFRIFSIMMKLIKMGADIHVKDNFQNSILHQFLQALSASNYRNYMSFESRQFVRTCLDKGIDCLHVNNGGRTFLQTAQKNGISELINLITPYVEKQKAKITSKITITTLSELLDTFDNENSINNDAARKALEFIEKGEDPNTINKNGETLLILMVKSQDLYRYHEHYYARLFKKIMKLISLGADINVLNNRGNNILHIFLGRLKKKDYWNFMRNPSWYFVKECLDKGIDSFHVNNRGETITSLAVKSGVNELVRLIAPRVQKQREDIAVLALNMAFNHSKALLPNEMLLMIASHLGEQDLLLQACNSILVEYKNAENTLYLIRAQCALEGYHQQWNYFVASKESWNFFSDMRFHLFADKKDQSKAEKVGIISNDIKALRAKKDEDKSADKSSALSLLGKFHLLGDKKETKNNTNENTNHQAIEKTRSLSS